jgi:hypothetical protein
MNRKDKISYYYMQVFFFIARSLIRNTGKLDQEHLETGLGTLDPDLQYKLLPIGQTRKTYRYIRLSL